MLFIEILFEARTLLEIAEAKYKKASIIFCSQFKLSEYRKGVSTI